MLTPQDDLAGHQIPQPFSETSGSDSRFTERWWYTAHPVVGGSVVIDIGFGYYPNRGIMDAFAGVTVGRKQYNFRCSRQLKANPLEIRVGPLKLNVSLNDAGHTLILSNNESGIAFELEFIPVFPPAREKQSFRGKDGFVIENLARFTQFGEWRGWMEVGGRKYQISRDTWWGQRDRSWGIRSEMRTDWGRPPMQTHKNLFWIWMMLRTEKRAISLFLKERKPGESFYISGTEFQLHAGSELIERNIIGVSHELRWVNDTLGQSLESGELVLKLDEGAPVAVAVELLPARFYLKGGLYGGWNGWNHGDDKGQYAEEHDVWDLDDRVTRERARTLSDHVVRGKIGTEIGYGIMEYGVASGYPLYSAPQVHPAF